MDKEKLKKEVVRILRSSQEYMSSYQISKALKISHPYRIDKILIELKNENKIESEVMNKYTYWRWKR